MSVKEPLNQHNTNEELDLGQLFTLIQKAVFAVFKGFLRIYHFFRKRAWILIILGIVGLALGYGLTMITSTKLKTDVIVTPTLESKRYLFTIIDEINANIKAKDSIFFDSLQIDIADLKDYEVTIESLDKKSGKELESELQYMEVLQDFENSEATSDIIRNLLLDQNSQEQRITFAFLDPVKGPKIARKLMDYVNNNAYFVNLIETYTANAKNRLKMNDSIIKQLDLLINNYTENMSEQITASEGQLVLQEEDQLDIHELFALKNQLIAESESKRIELIKRETPIRIVNFGKSQPVKLPIFGRTIFLIPVVLIALYLLYELIKYLNRKSDDILLD